MKRNIKIVTAGAGSGKTYRLASEVLEAIQGDEARPEGILLTTFTRKAAAELEERVQDYAARIARQATGAIARIKGCVNTGIYQGTAKGLAEERRAVVENFESPDVSEGVEAFLAGRKPRFRG